MGSLLGAALFKAVLLRALCGRLSPTRPLDLVLRHTRRRSFVDDLAAAFINLVIGLGPIMAVFALSLLATGLHLHIRKVAVVNYSTYTHFDLRRRLHERACSSALVVKRVSLCPSANESFWGAAFGNYSHRCAALRAPASHLWNRMARYGVYLSVLMLGRARSA